MREILFRGKSEIGNVWREGYYIKREDIYGNVEHRIVQSDGAFYVVIPETVGQYTGLKDKNGKKIFEGDKIKNAKVWYAIVFENGGYGLRPFGKSKSIPIMGHWNFNANEFEIIGNIHDNPELLEV